MIILADEHTLQDDELRLLIDLSELTKQMEYSLLDVTEEEESNALELAEERARSTSAKIFDLIGDCYAKNPETRDKAISYYGKARERGFISTGSKIQNLLEHSPSTDHKSAMASSSSSSSSSSMPPVQTTAASSATTVPEKIEQSVKRQKSDSVASPRIFTISKKENPAVAAAVSTMTASAVADTSAANPTR